MAIRPGLLPLLGSGDGDQVLVVVDALQGGQRVEVQVQVCHGRERGRLLRLCLLPPLLPWAEGEREAVGDEQHVREVGQAQLALQPGRGYKYQPSLHE